MIGRDQYVSIYSMVISIDKVIACGPKSPSRTMYSIQVINNFPSEVKNDQRLVLVETARVAGTKQTGEQRGCNPRPPPSAADRWQA